MPKRKDTKSGIPESPPTEVVQNNTQQEFDVVVEAEIENVTETQTSEIETAQTTDEVIVPESETDTDTGDNLDSTSDDVSDDEKQSDSAEDDGLPDLQSLSKLLEKDKDEENKDVPETSSSNDDIDTSAENDNESDVDVDDIPASVPSLRRTMRENHLNGKKIGRHVDERMVVEDTFTPGERMKWDEIHKWKNEGRIVKAQVIKALHRNNMFAAQCQIEGYKEFSFLVPFEYMDFVIEEENNLIRSGRKQEFIERLIGANINIVIEELDYKTKLCIGNRALANFYLRRKFFYRGVRRNNAKRKTVIYKGTRIQSAQVISVYDRNIRVEAFGAQFRIPIAELSHELISTCYGKFTVGQTINILVQDITYPPDKSDYRVNVTASVKALQDDTAALALEKANPGDVELAEVIRITQNQRLFMKAATGYSCYSRSVAAFVKKVREGSIVKIKLLKKDPRGHYGICDVTDIISL